MPPLQLARLVDLEDGLLLGGLFPCAAPRRVRVVLLDALIVCLALLFRAVFVELVKVEVDAEDVLRLLQGPVIGRGL